MKYTPTTCAIMVYVPDKKKYVDQYWGLYNSVVSNPELGSFDFIVACPQEAVEKLPPHSRRSQVYPTSDLASLPQFRYRYSGEPYRFINSFIHFVDPILLEVIEKYDNLLRVDCDTFICPSMANLIVGPNEVMVGRGAYSNEVSRKNLEVTAKNLGLTDYTEKVRGIGSTWFGSTAIMLPLGKRTVSYVAHLLDKDLTFKGSKGKWPHWFAGVVLLYAGDLVMNSCSAEVIKQSFDGISHNDKHKVEDYYTLHMWHSGNYFSKAVWENKNKAQALIVPTDPKNTAEYAHFHAHHGREARKKRYKYPNFDYTYEPKKETEDTPEQEVLINFCHIPKTGGTSLAKLAKKSKYIKHLGHNYKDSNIKGPTMLIVREPTDRFCSALRFNFQYLSNYLNIKELVAGEITTPDSFIQCLGDSTHPQHRAAHITLRNVDRVDNKDKVWKNRHFVGGVPTKWRWEFTPQSDWIKDPTYVLLFDDYEEEIKELFKHLGIPPVDIPKMFVTKKDHKHPVFSEDSMRWLKSSYKQDYILYDKYKKMSLDERLHRK